MNLVWYSHRHADAIIRNDRYLNDRYIEFINALQSITDDDLIRDFNREKAIRNTRGTNFKSLTTSINTLIKERIM